MDFIKRLFGSKQAPPPTLPPARAIQRSSTHGGAWSEVEDVRSGGREEGEVILNLWFVTNGIIISALRSKAYVASGADDQMLSFLRERANHDFEDAYEHPVPEKFQWDFSVYSKHGTTDMGKVCVHSHFDDMGIGYPALFCDVFRKVPTQGFSFNPSNVMMCVTALVKNDDGNLEVSISKRTSL